MATSKPSHTVMTDSLNPAAGVQKASHERMLNDKGRKVIKEKIGNTHFNSYEYFIMMDFINVN